MDTDSEDEIDYDQPYSDLLNKCRDAIKNKSIDISTFLDKVYTIEFFPARVINDIKSLRTTSEKIDLIIDEVQKRGQKGFQTFVKLLKKSDHSGLVKYLNRQEEQLLKQLARVQEEKEAQKMKKRKAEEDAIKGTKDIKGTFSAIREASRFDGRVIELDPDWCETAIQQSKSLSRGRFGEIFLYKENNLMLAVRKIPFEFDDNKKNEALNWVYWGHLMHFAISPLLATSLNSQKSIYYLVYPFYENGTLEQCLKDDDKVLISSGHKKIKLNQKLRLKIIYQIAAAIAFLHRGVKHFRKPVMHGDVASGNVYLDINFNARLANFAKAEECTDDNIEDKTRHDVKSFAVVVIELLISKLLNSETAPVDHDVDTLLSDYEAQVEEVWRAEMARKEIIDVAKKCSEGGSLQEIKKKLKMLFDQLTGWTKINRTETRLCDVCMINQKVMDDIIDHKFNCKIQLCLGCMRNSYLNPIICPVCEEDIIPPIGQNWGALLIAGNDLDEKTAQDFSNDVNKVKEKITSMYPLTMGISKQLVYVVKPESPGIEEPLLPKLQENIHQVKLLVEADNTEYKIQSLLVYFTGHHHSDYGFQLGENNEYLLASELERHIQTIQTAGCKKVLVLLDCCAAPPLDSTGNGCFIQMNSSLPQQCSGGIKRRGSFFTNFFLKALSGKASGTCMNQQELKEITDCEICSRFKSDTGFLTIDNFSKFINQHQKQLIKMKGYQQMDPVSNMKNYGWKESAIAYFIDKQLDFEFELHVGPDIEVSKILLDWLPERMEELRETLFEKFAEVFKLPVQDTKKYADVLVVARNIGINQQEAAELVFIEQVVAAWNRKQKLRVQLRSRNQVHQGRIGLLLNDKEPKAGQILEILQQDSVQDLCKLQQREGEQRVIVPLANQGLASLYERVEKQWKANKGHDLFFLSKEILLSIKNNSEVKEGNLVFTFPEDSAGNIIQTLMVIAVEDEPRTLGPTVLPPE